MSSINLAELLATYRPGSHGDDWTWDDEAADLVSAECYCTSVGHPSELADSVTVVSEPCGQPGHYQLMLERHLSAAGRIEQPIHLGPDGRVWDGHHRIVAAMRLGFDQLPVADP